MTWRAILLVQIEKTVITVFTAKELKIRKSDVTVQWVHFVMTSRCN